MLYSVLKFGKWRDRNFIATWEKHRKNIHIFLFLKPDAMKRPYGKLVLGFARVFYWVWSQEVFIRQGIRVAL